MKKALLLLSVVAMLSMASCCGASADKSCSDSKKAECTSKAAGCNESDSKACADKKANCKK